MPREVYKPDAGKPIDLYTWIYAENERGERKYLAGTAGRISITSASFICEALNEYELCVGESK